MLFFCHSLLGEEINKTYAVKVSGIKIGELNWQIKIDNYEYLNKLDLNSRGLLSAIYNFKGEYVSEGKSIIMNWCQKNISIFGRPKKQLKIWR